MDNLLIQIENCCRAKKYNTRWEWEDNKFHINYCLFK